MEESQQKIKNKQEYFSFLSYFESAKMYQAAFKVIENEINFLIKRSSVPRNYVIYALPICFIFSHALECYFKAFLVLKGYKGELLRSHDIEKIYSKATSLGFYDEKIPNHDEILLSRFKELIKISIDKLSSFHSNEYDFADRYLNMPESDDSSQKIDFPFVINDFSFNCLNHIKNVIEQTKYKSADERFHNLNVVISMDEDELSSFSSF